jgi:hypothetical protein
LPGSWRQVPEIVDIKPQQGQSRQQRPQVNNVNTVNQDNTVQTPLASAVGGRSDYPAA